MFSKTAFFQQFSAPNRLFPFKTNSQEVYEGTFVMRLFGKLVKTKVAPLEQMSGAIAHQHLGLRISPTAKNRVIGW